MTHKRLQSLRKASIIILSNFAFVIILFLIVEGLSSTVLFTRSAFFQDLIAEKRHTQYDEEIGWINLPNLSIKDMYGSKSFITNSMSFRNDKEFSSSIPFRKVRVVCSGDSFTMGYGVGNDAVWCKLLEPIDNRIETVNLGQGGYGVDQAYLWYKRNSPKLEHDIHIFAFITPDFIRVQSDTFVGYGKPFLVVQDDVLVNKNRPVPELTYRIPRLPKVLGALRQFSALRILKQISSEVGVSLALDDTNHEDVQTKEVVAKIIEDLQEISQSINSTLVLVHLPTGGDYMNNESDSWRHFVHAEAVKRNIIFIDLIEEFRKSSALEVNTLFDGHYTEEGNLYIANIMYEKLLTIPEIAHKFRVK